jgi:hypothetical protein
MSEQEITIWTRRLAPGITLLAICLGYLAGRGYPLLRPEVFLILAGAMCLGALLGVLCEFIPDWACALLLGMLLILFLSFVFAVNDHMANALAAYFGGSRGKLASRAIGTFVGFVLPLAGAFALRRTLPVIVFVAMAVFIVGALLRPAAALPETKTAPEARGERPNHLVLHIVLDEFVGNEGLGSDFPDSASLREDISRFFLSRGFSLHEGAFSSYKATRNSIPAILNFSRPVPADNMPLLGSQPFAWFRKLHNEGYRIQYVGISSLPECEGANAQLISVCSLFSLYAAENVRNDNKPALYKAVTIVQAAIVESDIYRHALDALGYPTKVVSWDAANQIDIVQEALTHEGGNLAVVAHILLPHFPFFYDANCVRELANARRALESREAYERAYSGQVRCALKRLGGLVSIVDRRWPGALIIVHGDHGLRHLIQFERSSDVKLNFAALFAVRGPGIKAGVVSKQENLQTLFAFYAGGIRLPETRTIYLDSSGTAKSNFPP